ncbi:polysaccharide deacetylase family protein [Natrinema halophilum]|uniref:Polysaccharide deacetylase family protein n=1 Tax=Natrinema halophilum TaxID=1699371 RepID=A0A7D5KE94_9EURY|nr:polysaccharide deacetylase family protein [Natrinema halophilum]QLG50016.1 polysaccharide deacetylase family protein [Natrinema halophilum]
MKRRAYLVTAAAATLGGCSALTDSETSEPSDDGGDPSDSPDETVDEEPGSFDRFDDLSMWTVMEGTLELDSERAYVGDQSGRMSASLNEKRVMIKRWFDQPRDLSNEFPALALATDQSTDPFVQLSDTDGNRLIMQAKVKPGLPLTHHDLGVVGTDGDPDLSSIAHVKISSWAGDSEARVWCDDLHFVSRPDTGKVLIQFDDGTRSAYTRARSTLASYGFPATAFVSTDDVGGSGYLSSDHLETLQNDGWTIASRGKTGRGLVGLSESALQDEIQGAIDWLENNGFEDGAGYFAYPLNRYDVSAMNVVDEHHDIGFIAGHAGHADLLNPALAPRAVSPTADQARSLLDRTARYRTIATLSYGDLSGETGSAFEETMSYLSDLESAGDLEVVGPDDVASNHIYDA